METRGRHRAPNDVWEDCNFSDLKKRKISMSLDNGPNNAGGVGTESKRKRPSGRPSMRRETHSKWACRSNWKIGDEEVLEADSSPLKKKTNDKALYFFSLFIST